MKKTIAKKIPIAIKFIDLLQDSLKNHCRECDEKFEGNYCEYCRDKNLEYFGGNCFLLDK
jgi:hypothetical protein